MPARRTERLRAASSAAERPGGQGPGGPLIEKITEASKSRLPGKLDGHCYRMKITPLLIGLNIKNKCQFGGIRITGLDRIKACDTK
jgi:hypothetical protein